MLQDPHTLLPIAYRAASRVVRCRLLAEEAGERALHLLTLTVLEGTPPEHPKAWLRTVARRSACALLKSDWARTRGVEHEELAQRQAPYQPPRHAGHDFVRENLGAQLTPRQQSALAAAMACNSTRAAARSCGMQPRDFRRSLQAISRKAKAALGDVPARDAFADDCAVQFRLDR
jgi:DNA-directed RNA polymerase specialized sigma24 family protein